MQRADEAPNPSARRRLLAEQPLSGGGSHVVGAAPDAAWAALLDPQALQAAIPGAERVERIDAERFRAAISFGVGRVRGRYVAELGLSGLRPPGALDLSGSSTGAFGSGQASAHVELTALAGGRTRIDWTYRGTVSGPVALVGRRLLQAGSDLFIRRFFAALARRMHPGADHRR